MSADRSELITIVKKRWQTLNSTANGDISNWVAIAQRVINDCIDSGVFKPKPGSTWYPVLEKNASEPNVFLYYIMERDEDGAERQVDWNRIYG